MVSSAIMPQWRQKLKNFFDHPLVHGVLAVLILINMMTIGIEVSRSLSTRAHHIVFYFNNVILIVFAVEISGRIIAEGRAFFKKGANIFDFMIVSLALITFGGVIQALRTLRIFWLLRLLTFAPRFKNLFNSILLAIPNMMIVFVFLIFTIYTAALIGTADFGTTNPEFSGVGVSMGTLTKTMLMQNTWSSQYEALAEHHPYAWAFTFPTMIILNYLLLHLILGVIVSALQKQFDVEKEDKKHLFLKKFLQKVHQDDESPFSPETQAILQSLEEIKIALKNKE